MSYLQGLIRDLEDYLPIFANQGDEANFYGNDEQVNKAQENYEHLQNALVELNQIRE